MHRFAISAEAVSGDRIVLRDGQARHAAVVLRLRPGDQVAVFDGAGHEYDVHIERVGDTEVTGRIVAARRGHALPVHITVLQGIPKGARMDGIIRMGTELGIAEFVPFLSERTVAQARHRAERWRRVATEAAKQCGRSDVPLVTDPVPFTRALERVAGYDLILVPWEAERTRSIREVVERAGRVSSVALIIGPEGGLEAREVETAAAMGGMAVTLGPLILRTDTAAVVAAAMVLYGIAMRTPGEDPARSRVE